MCPPKRRVLISCEYSGVISSAFRRLGCEAWSCDLLPTEGDAPEWHVTGSVEPLLLPDRAWDLVIAHPPCTYLSVSGARWMYHPADQHLPKAKRRRHPRYPTRAADRESAVEFFMMFVRAWEFGVIKRLAVENPVCVMSSVYRQPDQIVQPYQFGHDAAKATCLWLHGGLPRLTGTKYIPPTVYPDGRKRWANQSPCGADKLGPGEDRAKRRAKTYQGIAEAMAAQWSPIL